jgi:transposase
MDRASLEQLLGQRLSLAEIGRRVGRHEATVSYWLKKYGLEAVNHSKHEAKGGLTREELTPLVDAGMSTMEIADIFGLGKTTVRHWLREYGLKTQWAERRVASGERQPEMQLQCQRHGVTTFKRRSGGDTDARNVEPRQLLAGGETSSAYSSRTQAGDAPFVATAGVPLLWSSIISCRLRRASL